MRDIFSKFTVAIPIATETTEKILQAFINNWVQFFGYPLHVVSDNGPCFTDRRFEDFLRIVSIRSNKTAVYRPQANGQLERTHGTIKRMLTKACNEEKDWPHKIGAITHAFNAAHNNFLQCSPFFAAFGRDPISSSDALKGASATTAYGSDLKLTLEANNKRIADLHIERLRRVDETNARLSNPVTFAAGEGVTVKEPRLKKDAQAALKLPNAPYKIVQKLSATCYAVPPLRHGSVKVVYVGGIVKKLPAPATADARVSKKENARVISNPATSGRYYRAKRRLVSDQKGGM